MGSYTCGQRGAKRYLYRTKVAAPYFASAAAMKLFVAVLSLAALAWYGETQLLTLTSPACL